MPHPLSDLQMLENRRQFFGRSTTGIGTIALASLLNGNLFAKEKSGATPRVGGLAIMVSVLLVSVLAGDLPRDALTALVAGGIVAAVGLLDDLGCGRGPLLKLAVSLAVAAATVALTDVYVSY